jgi:hypothetical protein
LNLCCVCFYCCRYFRVFSTWKNCRRMKWNTHS